MRTKSHDPLNGKQITYFKMSDVNPIIKSDTRGEYIQLCKGFGMPRSWGRAFVDTHILINTQSFIAVVCGYSHKHGGGQGWYYFEKVDGQIHRHTASQLSVCHRRQVYQAWGNREGLGWIKRPFASIQPSPPTSNVE